MTKTGMVVAVALVLAGCASPGAKKDQDAQLVGVRAPLIADGMQHTIYFTHLDNRELRSTFDQYPTTVSLSPGSHLVTAVCEWRDGISDAPVAKHVRRFRMDVDAEHVIQFESSFEGGGTCQLAWKDVTNQNSTTAPGAESTTGSGKRYR